MSYIKRYGVGLVSISIILLTVVVFMLKPCTTMVYNAPDMLLNIDSPFAQFITQEPDSWTYHMELVDGVAPIDLQNAEPVALQMELSKLHFGVYTIQTNYTSNQVICNMSLGNVIRERYLWESDTIYPDGSTSGSPLWVTALSGIENAKLYIGFHDTGNCTIKTIIIQEVSAWRWGFLLLEGLIVGLLNLWFYVWRKQSESKRLSRFLGILLILYASFPALSVMAGATVGTQLQEQLNRIAHIAAGAYGTWSWQTILLVIPACLHRIGLPLAVSYNMFVVIINILIYVVAHTCFKWAVSRQWVYRACTVIYMLALPKLQIMYEQSNVVFFGVMIVLPALIGIFLKGIAILFKKQEVSQKAISYVSGVLIAVAVSVFVVSGYFFTDYTYHQDTTRISYIDILHE